MPSLAETFSKKILWIKQELKNLKTAHVKTATTIATTASERTLTFALKLHDYGGGYYEVFSAKRAVITLSTSDDTNMISAVYLKNVTPNNVDGRNIFVRRRAGGSHNAVYEIWIYSMNANDYNTLIGGGSVSLNYTIQMVGSSKFTSSVTWEDLNIS